MSAQAKQAAEEWALANPIPNGGMGLDRRPSFAAGYAAATAKLRETNERLQPLEDQLDLNRDEFSRIKAAPGCTDEIRQLCERSEQRIKQKVSVIYQLEKALEDKRRMDWLDENWCAHFGHIVPKLRIDSTSPFKDKKKTIREAIDAALTGTGEK